MVENHEIRRENAGVTGKLYGIGVGPGDPELLTLKAVRCIGESDRLILPAASKETCYAYQIAVAALPELAEKECICLEFPMIKEKEQLEKSHDEIYHKIREYLLQGETVGFLTIGDPAVYSTFEYIRKRAAAEKFEAHVINGVPSFCAAAAAAGRSLADSGEQIHILPASYEDGGEALPGTRIYMKSGRKLGALKKQLLHEQKTGGKHYDIWAVSNCGMANERVFHGLSELDENSGYLTIVIAKEMKAETV